MEWKPIETAPDEIPHVRGLWVYSAETGKPIYFDAHVGYMDDHGAFVDMRGDDTTGWTAEDFEWWAMIPSPMPEPPK